MSNAEFSLRNAIIRSHARPFYASKIFISAQSKICSNFNVRLRKNSAAALPAFTYI